jgi:hypothetical protein
MLYETLGREDVVESRRHTGDGRRLGTTAGLRRRLGNWGWNGDETLYETLGWEDVTIGSCRDTNDVVEDGG